MRQQTLVSSLTTHFILYRIGTRADANIHKTFACTYVSNNICTVVREWHHGMVTFALDISLPQDTSTRPRDIEGPEGVAAVCSGFCVRSWVS